MGFGNGTKGRRAPRAGLNALDLSSFREYVRTRKMGRSNEQAPVARLGPTTPRRGDNRLRRQRRFR